MATRTERNSRPGRESLSKRLGRVARQIKARDGHQCRYCGATAETSGRPLQLDHVVCRSHGGTDTADNLVLACASCNRRRSDKTLDAWCAEIGMDPVIIRAQAALPLAA